MAEALTQSTGNHHPRLGLFDARWLVADHDGRLLFVASSRLAKRHVIVRLSATAEPTVEGILWGKGALAFAPVVDPNGYSLPLRTGDQLTGITRSSSLALQPATWLDPAGCP